MKIIGRMTWDEYQDLYLKVAREVGAELNLHVELADPEDPHDAMLKAKPIMMRRWGLFRRRPQLREVRLAFYQRDNRTQPYFETGWLADLNELDKLDPSAYRTDIEKSVRDAIEHAVRSRQNPWWPT